jgi:hypothetical protein
MAGTKNTATQVGRDTTDRLRESMATSDLTQKAKEAAYTLVGLGVMGAHKATAATKSAAKQLRVDEASKNIDLDTLKAKSADAKAMARRHLVKADDVLGDAFARIEEAFAPLEDRLPEGAQDTMGKFREASKGLRAHVRTRFVETDESGTDVVAESTKAVKKAAAPKE